MNAPIRLSDAEALRKFSPLTRKLIKQKGFVRCLEHPNAWHPKIPRTPRDMGNSDEAHGEPCRCRVGT